MFNRPRDYSPLIYVVAWEAMMAVGFFRRRIALALLDVRQDARWDAIDTGIVISLALGLAVGVWLWVRSEAG